MARDHARIQTSIWIDDDFLDLTPPAQHLYMVLCTQLKLSFCGVFDWRPGRIAQLSQGWTTGQVERAAAELAKNLYIVIDDDAEEVLVRSFIRNDGLLSSPNITKAMFTAYSAAMSRDIRGVIVHELKRLHNENPALKGWEICKDLLGKRSIDPSELPIWNPSINPSRNPSETAIGNPSTNPSATPYSLLLTPNSSTPDSLLPAKSGYSDDFESVYALYPIKAEKKTSAKAFEKALKEISLEEMKEAVIRYRDDPNREVAFTKKFSTWLNGGCWDDGPLPNRRPQGRATRADQNLARGAELMQHFQNIENQQNQIGA
jgi:hypothetical protein